MVKECKAFAQGSLGSDNSHGEGMQGFYVDSLKNKAKRDYTVLPQIFNDALFEHAYKGDVPRKGKGRVHVKHYKNVNCTQQHDSVSCGYHLCYHMDIFVMSQKNLNKGVEIQLFGTHLESNLVERTKNLTRIFWVILWR
jgi:hypothetical protein